MVQVRWCPLRSGTRGSGRLCPSSSGAWKKEAEEEKEKEKEKEKEEEETEANVDTASRKYEKVKSSIIFLHLTVPVPLIQGEVGFGLIIARRQE